MKYYTQCMLVKQNKIKIGYIPTEFAVEHKILQLNGDKNWTVTKILNNKVSKSKINIIKTQYVVFEDVKNI